MAMQGAVAPRDLGDDVNPSIVSLRTELQLVKGARDDIGKQLKDANDQIEIKGAKIESLEGDVESLNEEVAELRSSVRLRDDEIRDLAGIRTMMKSGNCDQAREELERLLDRADNCWRTFA